MMRALLWTSLFVAAVLYGATDTSAQQGGTGAAGLPYVSNGPGQGSSYKVLTVPGGGTGVTTFTSGDPLTGNGTGAVGQGTRTGSTTTFATSSGTLNSGNCIQTDANGNLVDAGLPCSAGSNITSVPDRTALKALDASSIKSASLTENGRAGVFSWVPSNLSSAVSLDTNEGVYIAPASDPTGASGAWVRQFDFSNYQTAWFGAVADYITDNTAVINSMIAVANVPNTSSSVGRQRAAYINVGGGVKFATRNLSWLPANNWIFVYVNYFGNSNSTPGAGFGLGTNERETMSVNSGYPGDVTGGYVAENFFIGSLHPAIGVDINKDVDSSIVAHLPDIQAIQPTATNPVRASTAWISDERLGRFRIMYQKYGANDSTDGVIFYTGKRSTDLVATNIGVAGGWQSSSVPVAGDVVRDATTGGRYVVTSLATSILTCDWLSGAAVPGNFLMRERAIFRGSAAGTTLTVTSVDQGSGNIATGHTVVGMFANSGIAGAVTITGQSSGTPGGVGVYTLSSAQSVPYTQLVSGFMALNNIQGGGVVNTDTVYRPISIGLGGKVSFNQDTLPGTLTPFANGSGAATATLTNSPVAGNPTKWIFINDGGTTRRIPAW